MGAVIDTAIAVALGGGTAALATLIKTQGKRKVRKAIRNAVVTYLADGLSTTFY